MREKEGKRRKKKLALKCVTRTHTKRGKAGMAEKQPCPSATAACPGGRPKGRSGRAALSP